MDDENYTSSIREYDVVRKVVVGDCGMRWSWAPWAVTI